MGANISMDISAGLASLTESAASDKAMTLSFEDKLRQEVVLVPEDLNDIHIQAPSTNTEDDNTETTNVTNVDSVGGNPNTNPPRNRNKNGRKRQSNASVNANANTVPFQTERTVEQRREQVRPIIDKLTELQMNVSYPAIRELYKQLSQFIRTGEDMKIKIPFPEFSRKIKGELTNATYKPCWVKLEME
jgi:hypothetical protein